MRLPSTMLVSLSIFAATPAVSAGGWYVEALAGANFPDDVEFDIAAGSIETSLDDNYLWGFGFGYQFAHLRVAEIELNDLGTDGIPTIVSAEILLGFYRNWLVEQQYQFQENDAVQSADSAYFSLLGEHEPSGRSVNLGIAEYQGTTKVTLNHTAVTK